MPPRARCATPDRPIAKLPAHAAFGRSTGLQCGGGAGHPLGSPFGQLLGSDDGSFGKPDGMGGRVLGSVVGMPDGIVQLGVPPPPASPAAGCTGAGRGPGVGGATVVVAAGAVGVGAVGAVVAAGALDEAPLAAGPASAAADLPGSLHATPTSGANAIVTRAAIRASECLRMRPSVSQPFVV